MLLDTHVLLWLVAGVELSVNTRHEITRARSSQGVIISAVSVWEVGNLAHRGKVLLGMPLRRWVDSIRAVAGIREIDLSADIVVGAATLAEPFHRDPADRFLVSTARHLAVPLLTRDRRILEYAGAGHLQAVAC